MKLGHLRLLVDKHFKEHSGLFATMPKRLPELKKVVDRMRGLDENNLTLAQEFELADFLYQLRMNFHQNHPDRLEYDDTFVNDWERWLQLDFTNYQAMQLLKFHLRFSPECWAYLQKVPHYEMITYAKILVLLPQHLITDENFAKIQYCQLDPEVKLAIVTQIDRLGIATDSILELFKYHPLRVDAEKLVDTLGILKLLIGKAHDAFVKKVIDLCLTSPDAQQRLFALIKAVTSLCAEEIMTEMTLKALLNVNYYFAELVKGLLKLHERKLLTDELVYTLYVQRSLFNPPEDVAEVVILLTEMTKLSIAEIQGRLSQISEPNKLLPALWQLKNESPNIPDKELLIEEILTKGNAIYVVDAAIKLHQHHVKSNVEPLREVQVQDRVTLLNEAKLLTQENYQKFMGAKLKVGVMQVLTHFAKEGKVTQGILDEVVARPIPAAELEQLIDGQKASVGLGKHALFAQSSAAVKAAETAETPKLT